ncbi:hypothetical protein ACPV3S_12895 [Photobacterium damselae]|uniref:hypothetical protein n=2 Tax=Photobacterium damselae TaxID=38293 RepID=UPI0040692F34
MEIFFMPKVQIAKSAIRVVIIGPKLIKINDCHTFLDGDSFKALDALASCGFYTASQKADALEQLNITSQRTAPEVIINDILNNYDYSSDERRNTAFAKCTKIENIDCAVGVQLIHSIARKYSLQT